MTKVCLCLFLLIRLFLLVRLLCTDPLAPHCVQVVERDFTLADLAKHFKPQRIDASLFCTGFREEETYADDHTDYHFKELGDGSRASWSHR